MRMNDQSLCLLFELVGDRLTTSNDPQYIVTLKNEYMFNCIFLDCATSINNMGDGGGDQCIISQ